MRTVSPGSPFCPTLPCRLKEIMVIVLHFLENIWITLKNKTQYQRSSGSRLSGFSFVPLFALFPSEPSIPLWGERNICLNSLNESHTVYWRFNFMGFSILFRVHASLPCPPADLVQENLWAQRSPEIQAPPGKHRPCQRQLTRKKKVRSEILNRVLNGFLGLNGRVEF